VTRLWRVFTYCRPPKKQAYCLDNVRNFLVEGQRFTVYASVKSLFLCIISSLKELMLFVNLIVHRFIQSMKNEVHVPLILVDGTCLFNLRGLSMNTMSQERKQDYLMSLIWERLL